jgi:predicted O-methyltransferase YrrM
VNADLESQITELNQRLSDLQEQMASAAGTVREVERLLKSHLPRPDGRQGYKAIYNIADAMAWHAAETSATFISEHMPTAEMFDDRRANLAFAARNAPQEGMVLEFGIGHGVSLRYLRELLPERRLVGFDSFEGLPEDWRIGYSQGAFGDVQRGQFEGFEVMVGWFEDTLATFLEENSDPIALLHVDCDLYSSTVTVLQACMPRLAKDAIIVFDEFLNYPGWQQHEAKAWEEYISLNLRDFEYLAFVPTHEQLTLRVRS